MSEAHVLTKAAFSRHLGVSRARVLQYVAMGLPVRADGRLNLQEALRWVLQNIAPPPPTGGAGMTEADLERLLG